MPARSDGPRSADLSVWLEGWDRTEEPGRLVEGITGVGVEDVADAGDRWVQVDCPRRLARHRHALLAFAKNAAGQARNARVAIGLPCTARGLDGAEELLWRGVSVGVGPLSTATAWNAVAACFLRALERRRAIDLPVHGIGCVAWVPVGTIDALSDRRLAPGSALRGAAGTAVAQLMYLHAFRTFAGARWSELHAHGARPPRLGWNRLGSERRETYIERLALPGSVIALRQQWAAELNGHELVPAEADETEATWTSRELVAEGVPLEEILARVQRPGQRWRWRC